MANRFNVIFPPIRGHRRQWIMGEPVPPEELQNRLWKRKVKNGVWREIAEKHILPLAPGDSYEFWSESGANVHKLYDAINGAIRKWVKPRTGFRYKIRLTARPGFIVTVI